MPRNCAIRRCIDHGLMAWLVMLCAALSVTRTVGSENQATETSLLDEETVFFETKIRPLLAAHCYECHRVDKMQANLRLDLAEGWLKGGDSGPAVLPGNADESLLVRAVRYGDDQLQMPPDGKLPDEAIATFEEWVRRGARGGDRGTLNQSAHGWTPVEIEAARSFWAYRPLQQALPTVGEGEHSHHPIDRFVENGLRENGLSPNPRASRQTLIRRLTFDLHGLPPTPAEIEQFVRDEAPDAYTRLVDRLLASPRYSEHWGRHWLDLVRYAESLTLRGFILPQAWRYRDYVIRRFADDQPYDEFLREQLAGDLLPPTDEAGRPVDWMSRQERQIATTFWALGNTNLEEQDKRQLDMDVVDEQLDVLGRAILGQTLQCARCHDHKFDPIPTRDYYALAGILRNTQLLDHANVSQWKEVNLPLSERDEAEYARRQSLLDQVEAELLVLQVTNWDPLRLVVRRADRDRMKADLASRPKSLSLVERADVADVAIHVRGSVHTLGETVPRGFLQVIGSLRVPAPSAMQSGRRELAEWIVSPQQPLTPRVYANRVWCWLVGQGLVRSVDQFGMTGQPPTHPELLDHLATYFLDHDWSTQRLIRYIVQSETYQRSSDGNELAMQIDPENRWLWRMNRRRLEAEAIRDTLRMVGACLSLERGGSTIKPGISADYGYVVQGDRRSVYLPVLRNALPSVFTAFDFADPSMVVGQRQTSPSVSQALFLMNDPLVRECAQNAARRLIRETPHAQDADRLERAGLIVLGRSLSADEREILQDVQREQVRLGLDAESSWTEIFQLLFASVDFRYRD